jgi:ribosomal protein L28
MSYVCEICNKKSVIGKQRRHKRGVAGKRWKFRAPATPRVFRANLQKVKLMVSGKICQVRLCTKCLKKIKKTGKIKNYKSLNFV